MVILTLFSTKTFFHSLRFHTYVDFDIIFSKQWTMKIKSQGIYKISKMAILENLQDFNFQNMKIDGTACQKFDWQVSTKPRTLVCRNFRIKISITTLISQLRQPLDLCAFAINPPQFMRKTFSETCAVLDLYVVLTPLIKFLDS